MPFSHQSHSRHHNATATRAIAISCVQATLKSKKKWNRQTEQLCTRLMTLFNGLASPPVGDSLRGEHAGDGMAIAHGFPHHHDIRLNVLRLEAPEVRAGASETSLHLGGC